MFRKDAAAVNEWSEANVQLCKERQRRILADVWPALKPDGLLIYSTCTYNTDENEDNVQWLCDTLNARPVSLDIRDEWQISGALKGDLPVYRFLPHKTRGEGFFMAAVRKNGGEDSPSVRIAKPKGRGCKPQQKAAADKLFGHYLNNPDAFSYIEANGKWRAVPQVWTADCERLSAQLKIVSAGIELGEQKGRDFIPSARLALSETLNTSAFPAIETDVKTAISFLRRESVALPVGTEKGYVLLKYRQTPLGFVKNIGTRSNNLYPSEWRIRTSGEG
jgi:NOL1/NOP2/fmu family ribosome biogenesis protein